MGIKCMVEGGDTPEAESVAEVQQGAGGSKEETTDTSHRGSKTEQEKTNDTDEKVFGEQAINSPKKEGTEPSKKKTVMRSLRRPRWCGGSTKTDD